MELLRRNSAKKMNTKKWKLYQKEGIFSDFRINEWNFNDVSDEAWLFFCINENRRRTQSDSNRSPNTQETKTPLTTIKASHPSSAIPARSFKLGRPCCRLIHSLLGHDVLRDDLHDRVEQLPPRLAQQVFLHVQRLHFRHGEEEIHEHLRRVLLNAIKNF